MECPFELPVRLNKMGHFVCGDGKSYRDLSKRLSMSSKNKAYIVQAINSHEKLVGACKTIKDDRNFLDLCEHCRFLVEQALKEVEQQ